MSTATPPSDSSTGFNALAGTWLIGTMAVLVAVCLCACIRHRMRKRKQRRRRDGDRDEHHNRDCALRCRVVTPSLSPASGSTAAQGRHHHHAGGGASSITTNTSMLPPPPAYSAACPAGSASVSIVEVAPAMTPPPPVADPRSPIPGSTGAVSAVLIDEDIEEDDDDNVRLALLRHGAGDADAGSHAGGRMQRTVIPPCNAPTTVAIPAGATVIVLAPSSATLATVVATREQEDLTEEQHDMMMVMDDGQSATTAFDIEDEGDRIDPDLEASEVGDPKSPHTELVAMSCPLPPSPFSPSPSPSPPPSSQL
ncbi:hypothetical protein BC828DRAFT_374528 [Blastocladiella britannica]|nr:hypothetical protein BC828DRAFT_374528 [Blastocladiella britannica]